MSRLRAFLSLLRFGTWAAGCENWPGKPRLGVDWVFYDGWHFVVHMGPLWLEIY